MFDSLGFPTFHRVYLVFQGISRFGPRVSAWDLVELCLYLVSTEFDLGFLGSTTFFSSLTWFFLVPAFDLVRLGLTGFCLLLMGFT